MNYTTIIQKDQYNQWKAQTRIALDLPNQFLTIRTNKDTRGILRTVGVVSLIEGNREIWVGGYDYNVTLMPHPEVKRVTESAISVAHQKALDTLAERTVADAKAFYKAKGAKLEALR